MAERPAAARSALACWLLLLLCACSLPAQALSITDDRGRTVTLARAPQRIVSLLPSLTETVCELGGCARLVGVDRYSDFPASVRALPQVGGGLDPSVEAIVALRPDLVLAATSARVNDRLEALGLLLGVSDAQRVWRAIDAGVAAAAQSLPPSARGLRVYYEVNRGPYAAGTASFVGETLTRLGVRNIVEPGLGPFPKINPEFVVRADPDLIMIGASDADGLAERPGWAGMRAIREQRVCRFTPAQSAVLLRPGPRMAEAARLMARCIAQKAA
jgi:iron complex transport system substrate-binding protein